MSWGAYNAVIQPRNPSRLSKGEKWVYGNMPVNGQGNSRPVKPVKPTAKTRGTKNRKLTKRNSPRGSG